MKYDPQVNTLRFNVKRLANRSVHRQVPSDSFWTIFHQSREIDFEAMASLIDDSGRDEIALSNN